MKLGMLAGFTLATAVLAACGDITQPVAAVGPNGEIMKGTATARMSGDGEMVVTGPYGTCTGNYNSLDYSLTIPISLLCDDGTKALGSATRTASGMSGSGTLRDSKGREWQFVFGQNATALF